MRETRGGKALLRSMPQHPRPPVLPRRTLESRPAIARRPAFLLMSTVAGGAARGLRADAGLVLAALVARGGHPLQRMHHRQVRRGNNPPRMGIADPANRGDVASVDRSKLRK